MIDGRPGQPRLVVHNTFLEFDDKQENRAGGRPRAQTDITGRKMPRKVSYQMEQDEQLLEEGPAGFGKLGSLSEDYATALAEDPNQVVHGLSMGLGANPASSMAAAAAAAAQLGHPLLPSMPAPGYYPGLPHAPWPSGHPAQGFHPGAPLPPPNPLSSIAPGVWPYPLPYPALDPALAAMAHAATGPAPTAVPLVRNAQQNSSKGRGRGGRGGANANGRPRGASASDSPAQLPSPAPTTDKEAPSPKIPPEPPVNGTTVMLRNLPSRFSQETILKFLDEQGFEGKYDFVYLPMDFRNGINLGYAFVNTLSHEDALRAMELFQGFGGWTCDSTKVCEVSWAHPHQGFQEHVERYRNSPVMHPSTPEEYKPMIFSGGKRIPFPAPTKAIRAPKLKHNPSATDAQA